MNADKMGICVGLCRSLVVKMVKSRIPVALTVAGSDSGGGAIAFLQDMLIPLAAVVTPNRFEAEILGGLEIGTVDDMRKAAEKIHSLGAKAVLVKGGGMKGDLRGIDVWFDGTRLDVLKTENVDTGNTHGTGCTLSAAIAANLALGKDLFTAVTLAKNYVTTALKYALDLGEGQGPVGHFFPLLLK